MKILLLIQEIRKYKAKIFISLLLTISHFSPFAFPRQGHQQLPHQENQMCAPNLSLLPRLFLWRPPCSTFFFCFFFFFFFFSGRRLVVFCIQSLDRLAETFKLPCAKHTKWIPACNISVSKGDLFPVLYTAVGRTGTHFIAGLLIEVRKK